MIMNKEIQMPSEALQNYLDQITDPNGQVVASPKQIKEAIQQYDDEYLAEQQNRYGCLPEDLDYYINDSGMMLNKEDAIGATMVAASILSDAQEMIEQGRAKQAIQFINRAKYVMSVNRRALSEKEANNE
jgi:hypothetical protein